MKISLPWLGPLCEALNFKKKIHGIWMVLLLPVSVYGQQFTVSGTVKDSLNVPLIGVTVVQKGTTNGMMTDVNS
jgi:hypothetical protein